MILFKLSDLYPGLNPQVNTGSQVNFVHLLETIFNKVSIQSYYHLQQTNKDVRRFICNSSRIAVPLYRRYKLPIALKEDLRGTQSYDETDAKAELAKRYGMRLEMLIITSPGDFGQCLNYIREFRLSCDRLELSGPVWTKDQCKEMLELLTPIKIDLFSMEPLCLEALFQSNTLKRVNLSVTAAEAAAATRNVLLLNNKKVAVISTITRAPLKLLLEIFEIFCSQPLSTPFFFSLTTMPQYYTTSHADEIKAAIFPYKLIVFDRSRDEQETYYKVEPLPHVLTNNPVLLHNRVTGFIRIHISG